MLEAGSRDQLLALLEREDVRAVLLDVHLGADDGIVIARELRSEHPDLGVAFFSGSVQGLERYTTELSTELLSKPFTLGELTETVARLVLPRRRS